MAELPDFPSWVAEAEKWEAAIRKDQTARCVAIVRGMQIPGDVVVYEALERAAKAIEGHTHDQG